MLHDAWSSLPEQQSVGVEGDGEGKEGEKRYVRPPPHLQDTLLYVP